MNVSRKVLKLCFTGICRCLQHSFVVDFLLQVVSSLDYQQADGQEKAKASRALAKVNLFELIKNAYVNTNGEFDNENKKVECMLVMKEVIFRYSVLQANGQLLLAGFVGDKKLIIDVLLNSLLQKHDTPSRLAAAECFETILNLTKKSVLDPFASRNRPSFAALDNNVSSQMHGLKDILFSTVLDHLEEIVRHISSERDRSKAQSLKLSYSGLVLLRLGNELVEKVVTDIGDDTSTEVLSETQVAEFSSFLRCLEGYYVSLPNNTIVHKLLHSSYLLLLKHEKASEILKGSIQKRKFVAKIISLYMEHKEKNEPATSLSAHILALLNMIKLRAESLGKSSFLVQYLKGLESYRQFLSTLIEETETKLVRDERTDAEKATLDQVDHAKRTNFQRMMQGGDKPGNSTRSQTMSSPGIGLGSKFANDLGFEGYTTSEDYEGDSDWSGADNGAANATKKKRKKKKKTEKQMLDALAAEIESS